LSHYNYVKLVATNNQRSTIQLHLAAWGYTYLCEHGFLSVIKTSLSHLHHNNVVENTIYNTSSMQYNGGQRTQLCKNVAIATSSTFFCNAKRPTCWNITPAKKHPCPATFFEMRGHFGWDFSLFKQVLIHELTLPVMPVDWTELDQGVDPDPTA
jgi:hypothetical protein